jgi:hypothetical protein
MTELQAKRSQAESRIMLPIPLPPATVAVTSVATALVESSNDTGVGFEAQYILDSPDGAVVTFFYSTHPYCWDSLPSLGTLESTVPAVHVYRWDIGGNDGFAGDKGQWRLDSGLFVEVNVLWPTKSQPTSDRVLTALKDWVSAVKKVS